MTGVKIRDGRTESLQRPTESLSGVTSVPDLMRELLPGLLQLQLRLLGARICRPEMRLRGRRGGLPLSAVLRKGWPEAFEDRSNKEGARIVRYGTHKCLKPQRFI